MRRCGDVRVKACAQEAPMNGLSGVRVRSHDAGTHTLCNGLVHGIPDHGKLAQKPAECTG